MAVRLKSNSGQAQAVTTTSTAAVAFAAKPGELVRITVTNTAYLNIGGSGVAAASASVHSLALVPNAPVTLRLNTGDTHFRVIRAAADGVMTITRLTEDSN